MVHVENISYSHCSLKFDIKTALAMYLKILYIITEKLHATISE